MDIDIRGIDKRFGAVQANDAISFSVQGGRIVGILGENGAGKSTLMKILAGYQAADAGEILLDGQPLQARDPLKAIAQGIGMLQQDPLDIPAFSVIENFKLGSRLRGRDAERALRETSLKLGFELDPNQPIASLSIAQRQQLEIVRLLAQGVRAIILDEPTTGISAEQKQQLFDALQGLAREQGLTVLLVSHKLEDVLALCDEVVVLRGGQLVGQRDLPATKRELVAMMFGEELAPHVAEALPSGERVLRLDRVSVREGRMSVTDFSLDVHAGEVIGLAGLDGSGQDLIMRAMVGLQRLEKGALHVGERDMTRHAYRELMAAGVVFSAAGRLEEGLVAGLTLTEHVALTQATGPRIDWGAMRRHTEKQIKLYHVVGEPESTIEQLSGGNQQRMLMGLMPDAPRVLVLEQPTRGLDVDSARWIWQQLLGRRRQGTAIVFTSAELDEIVRYSDRIVVFYAGAFMQVDAVGDLTLERLGHLIGGDFSAG